MDFSQIPEKVQELIFSLSSKNLYSVNPYAALTSYLLFMLIAITLLVIFFALAKRGEGEIPKGRITNLAEMGVEFIRNDICAEIIGPGSEKYFPFVATIFFFVLFNNFLGLIPALKPGTGSIGITLTIGIIVFVMFNTWGIRERGFIGYFAGLVPKGVPIFIAPVVWVIEVFSMILRPFTLAIRLFANMYAGHIVLGVFSILVELALVPLIHNVSAASLAVASTSIVWMFLLIALYALEVLVAFIQAYVFTLLTSIYIGSAVHEH